MDTPLQPPAILAPPAGWLGFLGIKNGGKQPRYVAPDLLSVLDLSMFYRAGNRSLLFGPGAGVPAVQGNNSIMATVPQGKVWIFESFGGSSQVLGATAGVIGVASLINPQAGGVVVQGLPSLGGQRGLTGEKLILSIPGPFIGMPGDQIVINTICAAPPSAFNWFGQAYGLEVAA